MCGCHFRKQAYQVWIGWFPWHDILHDLCRATACRSFARQELTLCFLHDHRSFGQERGNGSDRGELWGEQGPDHSDGDRDFQDGLALFILDDDAADVPLVKYLLDL